MSETRAQQITPTGMLASYEVDLLFDAEPPSLPSTAERLRRASADGEDAHTLPLEVLESEAKITLRHLERRDAAAPPCWILAPAVEDPEALEESVQQSWWWPDAARAITPHAVRWSLRDHDLVTLDYRWRLRCFQHVLALAVEASGCRAVHWRPTQQLLDAADLVASWRRHDFASPIPGGINVRFFQLAYVDDAGADQEMLMDTLGLGALGLLDLQCHFRGLDPEVVAQVLYDTASYVFQSGAALREGDTVQGASEQDRWLCRLAPSLAAPRRDLCALDPGHPFAVEDESIAVESEPAPR